MSYQKYKEVIKATNEARRSAIRVLITRHQDEFDALYLEEANKCGLNPTKVTSRVTKKREEKVSE